MKQVEHLLTEFNDHRNAIKVMIEEMKKFLPDIPVKADACIMERWYKGAEPVFDNQGNLEIWRP